MSAPDEGARGEGSPRRLGWAAAITAAVSLAVILWMGLGWDALTSARTYQGKKNDYYSSLVHGFLSGHLFMDIPADPRLASPDPAVRAFASAPLDTAYYKGHFYLYFGVTPAALVLLPYAALTGSDLDPRVVVVLAVALGYMLALGTLRMVARDHFGRLGAPFESSAALVLAFATATPLLLTRAMFYEVVIATGYACVMAACLFVYRAWSCRGRPWVQLAWASLFLGLAVGCRPNLILELPALLAMAYLIIRRASSTEPGRFRLLAAAILPAAGVGAALAAYDYARFGNPFEFGWKYGLNGFNLVPHRVSSAAFIWQNLHWYYLTLPALGPYFPYVFPSQAAFGMPDYPRGETIHGQFPFLVLLVFVAVSAVVARSRGAASRLRGYVGFLGYVSLSVFGVVASLGIRADRYMVDFQAPLALALVLVAAEGASRMKVGLPRFLWKTAFGALAVAVAVFNLLAGIEEFEAFKDTRAATFERMESVGNRPSAWLERHGLLRYGPVELKVTFPAGGRIPRTEPLLTLGTPELTDTLYVVYYPQNRIQFIGEHYLFLGCRSDLIEITPGRTYTIRADMGALYPPLNHPFFARYGALQAHVMKSSIHVELDGKAVMNAGMKSYDAPPWTLEAGRNDTTMSPADRTFTGRIESLRRLPAPPGGVSEANNGLWRIGCVFPQPAIEANFPILSSGVSQHGTLIFVDVFPGNRIRFGVDEWGGGESFSKPIAVEPGSSHTLEIFLGPLARRAPWPAEWHVSADLLEGSATKACIWLDGWPVLTTHLRLPFDPLASLIDVGRNLQGFSTTPQDYPGPIHAVPFTGAEIPEFLNRNLWTQR